MKWRIFVLSLAITLVSVLVFGVCSAKVYYNSSVDDGKNYLRVYMNEFDENIYSLDGDGAAAFSEKLNGARVTFMDASGKVIADSAAESYNLDHSGREEIIGALETGEGFSVRSSSTMSENMIYYCKNFDGNYLVRVAIFTDSGLNIFVKTLPTLASFLAVMGSLSVLIAVLATKVVVNPVKKLAKEAAESETVTADYVELKPVADILNARNRDIKRQLSEINREKELVLKERASKDEFISNVTHEMNTPLTSIRGYAELLSANMMTDEQKAVAIVMQKNDKGRMTTYITQEGFYIILDMLEVKPSQMPSNAPTNDFNANTLIETLQEQLKAKDEQIQALNEQLQSKDTVINSLLEQTKNFQVLLQGQQVLSLPEKKRPFFKRLFSRNDNE